METSSGNCWIQGAIFLVLISTLLPLSSAAEAGNFQHQSISFQGFYENHRSSFLFLGNTTNIYNTALQLTPETTNDQFLSVHYNKSGRIFYKQPFRVWLPGNSDEEEDDVLASFNSTFVINLYRKETWNAGHGLAFLIAPNVSIPEHSYGQWLGLTNASTDGSRENYMVAVEFDTERQSHDPDGNHVGLNINSVRSEKAVPLDGYNITLSPIQGANYSVWVEYNGGSKKMAVYIIEEGKPKPVRPILNETLDLKQYVKQDSYFGFAASTGYPQIELNCVLKWNLEIEDLPRKKSTAWWKLSAAIGFPAAAVLLIAVCVVIYLWKRRRSEVEGEQLGRLRLRWLPGMPREFKYRELKKATNDFDERLKLGEGGFGIVYRGVLYEKDDSNRRSRSSEVAVKKFSRDSIKSKDDFMAELAIIHRLRHRHLVRLVGWCYDKGKLLLVYDFMPNGSLDRHLYDTSGQNTLNWKHRCKILTGIASALHYLHNEYDQKVVHRDLKASNILLDAEFNARLGDFGLARALENERSSYAELGLAGVAGTIGYVAPECFHTGSATPESDVFGFGAVVLEVVCGRNPGIRIQHEQDHYSLVDWVWMLHREGRLEEGIDQRLGNDFVVDEAKRLLLLGLACSHPIASERPQTQAIVQIMSGTSEVPRVPAFKPVFQWPAFAVPAISTLSSLSTMASSSLEIGETRSVYTSQTSVG